MNKWLKFGSEEFEEALSPSMNFLLSVEYFREGDEEKTVGYCRADWDRSSERHIYDFYWYEDRTIRLSPGDYIKVIDLKEGLPGV